MVVQGQLQRNECLRIKEVSFLINPVFRRWKTRFMVKACFYRFSLFGSGIDLQDDF